MNLFDTIGSFIQGILDFILGLLSGVFGGILPGF